MTEEDKPKRRAPTIQTSEDRDLAALERLRQGELVRSGEIGVVQEDEFDEDTKPVELVKARYDSDPAFRAIWDRVSRIKRQERQALQNVGNAALEAAQGITDDEIAAKVHSHGVELRFIKWIAGVVVTLALGSLIVIATKIFSWGVSSGEIEIRLQHLERDVESLKMTRPFSTPPSNPLFPGGTK